MVYLCPICGRTYKQQTAYKRHYTSHKLPDWFQVGVHFSTDSKNVYQVLHIGDIECKLADVNKAAHHTVHLTALLKAHHENKLKQYKVDISPEEYQDLVGKVLTDGFITFVVMGCIYTEALGGYRLYYITPRGVTKFLTVDDLASMRFASTGAYVSRFKEV